MGNKEMFLFALAIIAAAAVLFSPVACTMHQNSIIESAVERGADPIAVRCAMVSDTGGQSAMCVIKAAGIVKQQ